MNIEVPREQPRRWDVSYDKTGLVTIGLDAEKDSKGKPLVYMVLVPFQDKHLHVQGLHNKTSRQISRVEMRGLLEAIIGEMEKHGFEVISYSPANSSILDLISTVHARTANWKERFAKAIQKIISPQEASKVSRFVSLQQLKQVLEVIAHW